MIDFAPGLFSALGLFAALQLLLRADDLLRLRTMTRLAAFFTVAGLSLGPISAVAIATSFAACRLHPDLRSRPIVPLMLLMLTPMAATGVAMAIMGAIALPHQLTANDFALEPKSGALIAALAIPSTGLFRFSWRFRLVAASALSACFAGLVSAQFAAFGVGLALLVPLYAAAAAAAAGPADVLALRRAGYAFAFLIGAPLLIFAAQAGPWLQPVGNELLIVRAPLTGGGSPDGAYGVQTYSESGLTGEITFVASGYQETARHASKTGGMAGLRVALFEEDGWVVSGEAKAGVEPFSLRAASGDWEGHAQAEILGLAGWGGTIDGLPVYGGAGIGWRFRPGEFGDAVLLSLSGGVDLTEDLQLNVHAAMDLNANGEDTQFGQASLLWRIDETFALEAGVQSYQGQDGDIGAQAFAGVWIRF